MEPHLGADLSPVSTVSLRLSATGLEWNFAHSLVPVSSLEMPRDTWPNEHAELLP